VYVGRDLLDAWIGYMAKNVEFRLIEIPHDFACKRLEPLFMECYLAWLGQIRHVLDGYSREHFWKILLTICNRAQGGSEMLHGRTCEEESPGPTLLDHFNLVGKVKGCDDQASLPGSAQCFQERMIFFKMTTPVQDDDLNRMPTRSMNGRT